MRQHFEHEQEVAIRAVNEAARLCQAVRRETSPDVLAKKDKSPVTVADFGSQALICRVLASALPHDPVIAEEDASELLRPENAPILQRVLKHIWAVSTEDDVGRGGASETGISSEEVCRWIDHGGTSQYCSRFWTIDPIDGTKGFLRGEQYAIALALVVQRQVVVAAMACPNLPLEWRSPRSEGSGLRGAIFYAVRGNGAYVVQSGAESRTEATPVCISQRDDPRDARFCESVESEHSAHGDAATVAERLGMTCPPLRMDSQCKYAVVARGEADLYLRLPTRADYREKIWDHAAGTLIVEEAGGIVTDITGRPLEFHHGRELAGNQGVIVSNGRLHQRVLEVVRALGIQAR